MEQRVPPIKVATIPIRAAGLEEQLESLGREAAAQAAAYDKAEEGIAA